VQNEIEERRRKVGQVVRDEIEESQFRHSGAPMGLRSAFRRGGAPKMGGVRSVELIIGAPVGIEELPSRAEEHG